MELSLRPRALVRSVGSFHGMTILGDGFGAPDDVAAASIRAGCEALVLRTPDFVFA